MKFDMRLDKETINAPTDQRKQDYLFTRPKIPGSQPVNLADLEKLLAEARPGAEKRVRE